MTAGPLTVVLNPHARRCAGAEAKMARALAPRRPDVRVTHNLEELDQVLQELSAHPERRSGTLCFYGGDGSVSRGITAWIRARGEGAALPTLLAVRGGTINFLSSWLGIRGSGATTLQRWSEGRLAALRAVPTLRVRIGDAAPLYGFFMAWGVGERVLRAYYARAARPGPWDALVVAGQTIVRAALGRDGSLFERAALGMRVEGGVVDGDPELSCLSLLAGTVPRLSLGIRPFSPAALEPGTFHVAANGMELRDLARHVPRLLAGWGDPGTLAHLGLFQAAGAERLVARLGGGITLDGELHPLSGPTEVEVTPGPMAHFWVPV
ncbi:MAG: hypothetical protein IT285_05780 [Bdellovibrionales bacterium]|nr:hypothetical protein [Bdellovibrionales bacterium]